MTISEKILKDLSQFVTNVGKDSAIYHQKTSDFTRKGKLHFSIISIFICSLLKKVYFQKSLLFFIN